jgi:hypothetical protein
MVGENGLSVFILAFWGFAVSWIEERFGAFQILPPKQKQLVNSILNLIVPGITIWLVNPWWQKDFGDSVEFTNGILILLAPVMVWLTSQFAHYADRLLTKWTK